MKDGTVVSLCLLVLQDAEDSLTQLGVTWHFVVT